MSDSLQPHESQHARPPCPSSTPRVHWDSRPSSQWCHPSSHLILCRPFLLLPPIPPSIRVFSSESTLPMRWPKYRSLSFSIIPSKEIPGLIFRMDWLDLLAVQGTLKSLLQYHSSKASILRRSAFFTVQLSHPYMTTGKTIALTRQTFVGKVMSLLLNMLSRLDITFLPRRKRLLISWLQSPSAVILEPRKIKSDTVSTVYPSISHAYLLPASNTLCLSLPFQKSSRKPLEAPPTHMLTHFSELPLHLQEEIHAWHVDADMPCSFVFRFITKDYSVSSWGSR